MTPTLLYSQFPIQGSGCGLLSRLQRNERVGPILFSVICGVAVIAMSVFVIALGFAGCVVAAAMLALHGKAATIGILLLDAAIVAAIGIAGTIALFD